MVDQGARNQNKIEASITGEDIKTFVRLLQCASKFGDDLHMHATQNTWDLSVTNSSKSAFCLFKLQEKFFARWNAKNLRRGVKCRLLVKSMLAVLGKVSQINNVNRLDLTIRDSEDELRPSSKKKSAVAKGYSTDDSSQRRYGEEDEYESDDDVKVGLTATLVMKLVCKHGVIKRHTLHLGASDFLRADVDPDSTPSGFQIPTRTLRDWLDHFSIALSGGPGGANRDNASGGLNQLGWMFAPQEVRVKSWEGGSSNLSTEIKVDVGEFQEYEIMSDRVDLTLPMKEFKATLMLAEQLNINLNVAFSEPTQPLTLTSYDDELDNCSIFCAIATTSCDAFADVRGSSIDIKRSRSTPPVANARKRSASATPSQARKRSSLSFARGPESDGMANIITSNPAFMKNSVSTDPSSQQRTDRTRQNGSPPGDEDDDGGEPSRRPGQQEALFFPGSQPDASQPPATQVVRMSQQEILEAAGLGDMDDLDDALDLANEDDEKMAEEEAMQMQSDEAGAEANVAEDAGGETYFRMDLDHEDDDQEQPTQSTVPLRSQRDDQSPTRETAPGNRSPTKWATDNDAKSEQQKQIQTPEAEEHEAPLVWDTTIDKMAIEANASSEVNEKAAEEIDELDGDDSYGSTQQEPKGKAFTTFFEY